MGDGMLAEFASVVDAVACAVAIQDGTSRGLPLRIGINLGDVVVEGDDLLATASTSPRGSKAWPSPAESSSRAPPGTSCTASSGWPSRAWASSSSRTSPGRSAPIGWSAARQHPGTEPAAAPPERPSLAVLPFDNLSGDPAQAYFSDGITEDLITELSRFRDLSSGAPFLVRLARPAARAAELGRRLGVRYLLEGSVRKAGERVRITAQLIEPPVAPTSGPSATIARWTTSSRSRTRSWRRSRPRWPAESRRPASTGERKPTPISPPTTSAAGLDRLRRLRAEANAAARGSSSARSPSTRITASPMPIGLAIFSEEWGDRRRRGSRPASNSPRARWRWTRATAGATASWPERSCSRAIRPGRPAFATQPGAQPQRRRCGGLSRLHSLLSRPTDRGVTADPARDRPQSFLSRLVLDDPGAGAARCRASCGCDRSTWPDRAAEVPPPCPAGRLPCQAWPCRRGETVRGPDPGRQTRLFYRHLGRHLAVSCRDRRQSPGRRALRRPGCHLKVQRAPTKLGADCS